MSVQWYLCETGSTIAAIVALAINMQAEDHFAGAPTSVYIVFIVIQVFAMVMALTLLVRPKDIVSSDGTTLALFKAPTVKNEMIEIVKMVKDYKFMMLLPAIFAPEMALALQSSLNEYYFNLRTRSLNSVIFNFVQLPASFVMIHTLDNACFGKRKLRSLIGITTMSAVTLSRCSAEAGWLVQNNINRNVDGPLINWTGSGFAAPFAMYIVYRSVYSIYQIATQYVICALTNDPEPLARCAGVFRGVTAFGMMFSFVLDGQGDA